jgi:hypothetical protein
MKKSRKPNDISKMLTIAPRIEADYDYIPERRMLELKNLGVRSNVLGYIACGIQFLFSLHGKKDGVRK